MSLLQDGSPTVSQLKELYRLMEYARETPDAGVTLRCIPLETGKTISVGFSDSSWANAPDHKSQTGLVVTFTTVDALTGSAPASIVDWRSCRTKRQMRSTLAAESNAADNSIDHAYYSSAFLGECISGNAATCSPLCVPVYSVTDCKSLLYDLVIQHNPSCDEKRTLIDIKSIQHSLKCGAMRWVPTWAQMADALTKLDFGLMRRMTQWMSYPEVRLHD